MVLIVGAGIAGLYLGKLLQDQGVDFRIVEARGRIGGRVWTLNQPDGPPIEMGPTWFGPQHTYLKRVIEEFNLEYFEQYRDDYYFFQQSSQGKFERYQLPNQDPSFRFANGTQSIVNSIASLIDRDKIHLNQSVKRIEWNDKQVTVEATDTFIAEKVVLTVPPKLWAHHIDFKPVLPNNLIEIARNTQTWMEGSIKMAYVFSKPFWEGKGSTIFSNDGSLIEFYDHSDVNRKHYSLCGFAHPSLHSLSKAERELKGLKQLEEIYGTQANDYVDYHECVWYEEVFTGLNNGFQMPHQNNGNPIFREHHAQNRIVFSGSETSGHFAGYMEGAIYSAIEAFARVMNEN